MNRQEQNTAVLGQREGLLVQKPVGWTLREVDNSRQAHGGASLEVLVELLINFLVGLAASVAVEGPWCSANATSSYTGSKHSAGQKHAREKINLPWVAMSYVKALQLMCVQKYLLLFALS